MSDWTRDEHGRSNSSPEFHALVRAVADLIRGDAASLIAGRADSTAGLIVAQLAHRHGLAPRSIPPLDEWLKKIERELAPIPPRPDDPEVEQHVHRAYYLVREALAEHRKEGQHG